MSDAGTLSVGEQPWFAVQTKPHREERVEEWLRRQGGPPVFLPRIERVCKRRSRRVTVIEPLFPSYLFVQMTLEPDPWRAVRWSPGVKQIVCTGDIPTPVAVEAIQLIMDRCGHGGVIQWRPSVRARDRIRVIHGPFAGLQGILDRPTGSGERVRVLLQLLGSVTPVEMDVTDIELAS
jgi:transcriptional antiterminator RfaH